MRRRILIAAFLLLPVSPARGVEEDKVKHGTVSMAFGAAANSSMKEVFPDVPRTGRWVAGTTLALIPGIAKEMADTRLDRADLAADLVGSVIGVLLADLTGGRVWFQASEENVMVGLRFGGAATEGGISALSEGLSLHGAPF